MIHLRYDQGDWDLDTWGLVIKKTRQKVRLCSMRSPVWEGHLVSRKGESEWSVTPAVYSRGAFRYSTELESILLTGSLDRHSLILETYLAYLSLPP